MTRAIFIISPLIVLSLTIFVLGFLPISKATNEAQQDRALLLEQRDQLVLRLENVPLEKSIIDTTSFIWDEKSINQATLNLQSLVSEISAKHEVPVLLMGPKGSKKEGNLTRFTVEFETETSLWRAVNMLADLERIEPSVGIASLDLRHISKFDGNTTDVNVYMRLVAWGWISNEVN